MNGSEFAYSDITSSAAGTASVDAIWPGYSRREAKVLRLVLIDDHPVVREGICALLSLEPDMFIVGDAGDVDAGIGLVRDYEPDLVICDLQLPGYVGGAAIRRLRAECPESRVMVLTANDSLECMRESFAAGAIGYVRKDAMRLDLLVAVRRAASGAHAVCRGVGDMVMRSWLVDSKADAAAAESKLEPEERLILRLIALGVPTWRIAADLNRGVKVVEKYRASLLRRLNLSSTAAVARFAVSCNLLSRDEVDSLFATE